MPSSYQTHRQSKVLRVTVVWRIHRRWHAEHLLARAARAAARAEGFRTGALSIVVVGAAAMTTLHKRYHALAEPTDVLTFDLGTDRRRAWIEAEIVVCADVALRRANREVAAARAELALYVVHGVLHLAGYDDHRSTDFRRMHAREDELLRRLGIGPVFYR